MIVPTNIESSCFPFLVVIGRFILKTRLGDLTDKLEEQASQFQKALISPSH